MNTGFWVPDDIKDRELTAKDYRRIYEQATGYDRAKVDQRLDDLLFEIEKKKMLLARIDAMDGDHTSVKESIRQGIADLQEMRNEVQRLHREDQGGDISRNKKQIKRMKPDADRGKKQVAMCKAIAAKGGKATAHYSDLVFESAFYAYRIKNPSGSAWDATNSLTRQGQPLDRMKAGSAYKRAERIANRLSITVDDWFDSLV